ncbi:penicillin-binding protein 2 [Aquihabitans sp. G128]|uniref:peptidoglycan D,D-transpeptidase FtsI family protein n=1 Tax=Aquihabitans sp. G128 TaxID=2849779 RepID=UPI001C22AAAA|nr:penicillin-binding protein 2 [Aquihabitans sp. G128]QXC59730.1 penicillin-binding protein 2 [Aquihabitans sp. G128]
MDRSIRRLGVFLMGLFCVLFVQLNYIQVFRAEDLNTKPGNSRPVDVAFSRPRGTVSTADGVIVSRSVPSNDRQKFQREFPEGELYAAISGYFNYSFGATGIEGAFNDELSGRTAKQQVRSIGDLFTSKDNTGNIKLTVRSDVQAAAKAALGDQKGSVVVLDPQTGGVLALWSWPSFDPNKLSVHDYDQASQAKAFYEAAPGKPLLAKAYREIYAPGSTFKVVTGATGVESGKVTVNEPSYPVLTSLDVPQTSRNLSNFDGESCGGTLFQILAVSCNSSFGQMGLDLGGPTMVKGAEAFGFNQTPPFDLAAARSTFPVVDWKQNQPVLAQAGIGQGQVAASPLQMALVAAGIANDGVVLEPHVVDEIRDGDNELISKDDPTQWKRAVSPQTADIMRQAMRQVVATGTATRLQIDGLDVGAKTGTAQFGPSSPLQSHAWVIAWAGPAGQKPTVAVAVLVDGQPGNSEQTGGRVAAPIARAVIEAAMKPLPAPPAATTTTTASTTTVPAGGN